MPAGLGKRAQYQRSYHVRLLQEVPAARLPEHLRDKLLADARAGHYTYAIPYDHIDPQQVHAWQLVVRARFWPSLDEWVNRQLAQEAPGGSK
jgi:hypothetical protein